MLKTFNVVLIGLMLLGAGVVYLMKYDSERAAGRIAKLQHKISDTREAIAGLKAEWSLLNQPKRLQDLVEKYHNYLELDRLEPGQVASIDEIPMRPAASKPDDGTVDPAKPSRMLAIGKAGDLTGSIPKKGANEQVKKATDKLDALVAAKGVEPRPNDPINALAR
ncbi:MAG: hypothetical protein P4L82_19505 [Ancalomicrobiaceae bacterium]|nr:hypothetical protein [Ancalomicrobiaceae bacterium]